MNNSKIIRINTVVFFGGWTIIMLLGADFPPPIGFLWLVLLLAVLDFIQYKYLHFFLPMLQVKEKNLFIKNSLFFTTGGLLVSIFTLASDYRNTLEMRMLDILIWITVITIVAAIYGICFWFFNLILVRFYNK